MMDWKQEAKALRDKGLSVDEIAVKLAPQRPELTLLQVRQRVQDAFRVRKKVKPIDVIGVIGDVHCPFNHPNYLQFCIDTFKRYGVNQVVCIGDLVDNHAISRHPTEPNARGAYDEYDRALTEVGKYIKAFPKVKLCAGNHDDIPYRQAATLGIGDRFLKSFSELWQLPKTWEIADEFILNNVLFKHGIGFSGENAAMLAAKRECMSVVVGHLHSNAGVKYLANKRDLIFGMSVGCGIDVAAYAFAYGKHTPQRPILGCGIVFNSSHAEFVPMGGEYFRN